MQTKEFLQNMTTLYGGSGYEEQISSFIKQEFEAHCDKVTTDAHYMVTGIKSGNIPVDSPCRILICAHMDEITLLVKEIDEQGFLRVAKNGGFDIRLFPGLEVPFTESVKFPVCSAQSRLTFKRPAKKTNLCL